MFQFLKNLFKKGEKEEMEKMSLEQLELWLEKLSKEKKELLEKKLNEKAQQIGQEKELAKQNIKALEEAQLMNPDIPMRAKHFMQGNREAYIKKTILLLDFELPEKVEELPQFFAKFNEELKQFVQGSLRPFQILQEFFSNESKKIAENARNVEKSIAELIAAYSDAKLERISELRSSTMEIIEKKKRKEELDSTILGLQEQISGIEKEKSLKEKEATDAFKDERLQSLRMKVQESSEKLMEVSQKISEQISILEPALKRFERITFQHKKLIEGYFSSPLEALTTDFELKIFNALQQMKTEIEKGSIELKDKKKEKSLQTISKLTKEALGKMQSDYARLKKSQADLNSQLESSEEGRKLKQIGEQIGALTQQFKYSQRDLEELQKEFGKIDIEQMKSALISRISDSLGRQVSIC